MQNTVQIGDRISYASSFGMGDIKTSTLTAIEDGDGVEVSEIDESRLCDPDNGREIYLIFADGHWAYAYQFKGVCNG